MDCDNPILYRSRYQGCGCMQFYTYESRSLIQNLFFARFANKLNKYRYWGKKLSSKFSIPLDKGIISIN